jgi:hypothetical protein
MALVSSPGMYLPGLQHYMLQKVAVPELQYYRVPELQTHVGECLPSELPKVDLPAAQHN